MSESESDLAAMLAASRVERPVANVVAPRPHWEVTERNAEREAEAVVDLLRDYDLTRDEAVDVVAATFLFIAGRLSQRQVENRVTVVLKVAISRRDRKEAGE